MEAPKKIQVHLIKNNCDDWSIRGYSFLEDKHIGMTEYTRTDAFIDKACESFCKVCLTEGCEGGLKDCIWLNRFKHAMKGE